MRGKVGTDMKNYVNGIVRRLKCSPAKKREIRKWLESDISAALEGGEPMEHIMERMGTPQNAAKEFNDNFPPEELKAAVKHRRIAIAAAVVAALAAVIAVGYWMLPKGSMELTHFDEAQVEARAKFLIGLVEADDYEQLREYSMEQLRTQEVEDAIRQAKDMIRTDWGARESLGNVYLSELTQMGQLMVAVQVNVSYENTSVTYTIVLDQDLQMGGIYLK
ncbi:MAG: DUF3887 domain-containing protein [Roseburia sp.]|nr:DUF3887 domain-containing protein [Roseburia sp.]